MNYTLLDEFAKSALPGLVTKIRNENSEEAIATAVRVAYLVAEAMVREKLRRDALVPVPGVPNGAP